MAVSSREIKNKRDSNGVLTGRPGTVYDVNIKYTRDRRSKTHTKKGFTTKRDASQYEAEMRAKLCVASYSPPTSAQRKLTVEEYMRDWVEVHGTANLRKSTFMSYKSHLKNHVYPHIGYIPLEQLTPGTLDKLYRKLSENGLSPSSVKYAHRIISVALEQARKYHYIGTNPARDIITKFGKQGKTPDPYTIEQMRVLLDKVEGTPWELIIVLGGLYGLRLGEILGLRWRSINLENRTLSVVEQLPYAISRTQTDITEMAPVKSSERELPITESTLPYFQRQIALQAQQKQMFDKAYHENDLVISKADGSPDSRDRVSDGFRQLLGHLGLPRMRFHDTRHTAATNMHELTGDFFTVSQILGHSTKGIGNHLNVDGISSVTAVYVSVRNERKQAVLDAYHTAIHK